MIIKKNKKGSNAYNIGGMEPAILTPDYNNKSGSKYLNVSLMEFN